MKFRRFLSNLLLVAGCVVIFIGLFSIVLPQMKNAHLQLVLNSFHLESEQFFVRMMNNAVCFSLDHSWPVLTVGLLSIVVGLLFHPASGSAKSKAVRANEAPAVAHPLPREENNPFAVSSYPQNEVEQNVSPLSFHVKPILEPNRISFEEDYTPTEETPYFSPRYTAETHAVKTSAGSPSQSGHYILIRPEPEAYDEDEKTPTVREEIIKTAEPAVSGVSPLKPASSLRIRSTMGRHDSINGKISSPRS